MNSKSIKYYLVFFLLVIGSSLYSQNTQKKDSIFISDDFFTFEDILEFDLIFDIDEFKKEKSDSIYLPAVLRYRNIAKNVRVRSRGIYRNNYCSFPPLLLNVKKANITEGLFVGENKYKIVTHCKNSKQNNNNLFKEYITYKLLNIISDYSFKVRLAKINYINTSKENDLSTNWAFIIEPEDVLAERLKTYPLKRDNMKYRQADTMQTTIMSIFQYMIGNTDYSIGGRHNVKLLVSKDHTKPGFIPVPYDFDFAGIVNAYYAKPNPDLPIKSVTERLYYGMCRSDDIYNEVLDMFREKKEEMYNYIYSCDFLDKKTSKYLLSYLDEFYKQIDKRRFIELHIRTTCEGH